MIFGSGHMAERAELLHLCKNYDLVTTRKQTWTLSTTRPLFCHVRMCESNFSQKLVIMVPFIQGLPVLAPFRQGIHSSCTLNTCHAFSQSYMERSTRSQS